VWCFARLKMRWGCCAQSFLMPKPNQNNIVLFSTSGIHGSYTTIEEVEEWLHLEEKDPDEQIDRVTFLVVRPR